MIDGQYVLPPLDISEDQRKSAYESMMQSYPEFSVKGEIAARIACRERQLAHSLKMNRLILRDSLTQKYGRNPTEEEMQLWMKIWSDQAGVK